MMFLYLLCGVVALLLVQLIRNFFAPGLGKIRGPILARFSNLWRLYYTARGDWELTLYRLHQQYGDAVRIGPRIVSISNPEAIEGIYGTKTDFVKSDYFEVMKAMQDGRTIPTLVTTKDSQAHSAMKRPIASAFAMSSMVKYEPIMDDVISFFVRRLSEEFVAGSQRKSCDIDKWIQYFSFDITGELTFSRSFGFLKEGRDVEGRIGSIVDAFVYFAVAGQMPIIDYYLTKHPILTKIIKVTNPYITASIDLLNSRLQSEEVQSKGDERRDLVARFLEAKGKGGNITDDVVIGYVMTMLMAGSDTTSVALRTVVYHLAKHNDVRRRLQAELDGAPIEFPVAWKDSQTLPYLDAVIKEALRVYPIGAVLQERVVPQTGFELPDGRRIPPETIVGIAGFNTNRREEVWGDRPESFNPDRWFPLEGESPTNYNSRLNAMKRFDISFGHGPRGCLGKNIALLEMYKLIATLFGLFEIELASPGKPWKTRSGTMISQTDMDVKIGWRKNHSLASVRPCHYGHE